MSSKTMTQLLDEHAAIRQQQIVANQENLRVAQEYVRIMAIPSGKAGGGKRAKGDILEQKNVANTKLQEMNKRLLNIEKEILRLKASDKTHPSETAKKDDEAARLVREKKDVEAARPTREKEDTPAAHLREKEDAEVVHLAREKDAKAARLAREKDIETARLARKKDMEAAHLVREKEDTEAVRLAREKEYAEAARLVREKEDAEVVRLARDKDAEAARLAREKDTKAARHLREKEEAEAARLMMEKEDAKVARLAREKEDAEALRLAREKEDAEALCLAREKEDAEASRLAREKEDTNAARLAREEEDAEVTRLAREKENAEAADLTRQQEAYMARQQKMHMAQERDAAAIAAFLMQNYENEEAEQTFRKSEEAKEGARLVKQMRLSQEKLKVVQQPKRHLDEPEDDESEEEREQTKKLSRKKQKLVKLRRLRDSDEEDLAISTEDSEVETTFFKKRKIDKKRENEGRKTVNKKETQFKTLTDKQMDNMRKDGEIAITNFLRNPAKYSLDPALRKMIRENQTFLPRAATTSRLLALEVLETNRYNIFCLYHHTKDKAGKVQDGEGQFLINGVPHERQVSQSTNRALRVTPPKGYLNCGCDEEMALLDFFLWKTWSVTAEIDGEMVTEGLKEKVWSPRERMFIVEQYRDFTGLTVDNLYAADQSDPKVIINWLKKQITFQLDRLNTIEAAEGADEARVIHPVLFPVFSKITRDGRDLMDFAS